MRAIFQGCISRTRKGYNMSKKEKTKRINREAALPRLNMRTTLTFFASVPMIVTSLILSIILVSTVGSELKTSVRNSMLSLIKQTGAGFDYTTRGNETMLKDFATAPIVKELLKNPSDAKLAAKAQEYTLNFYGNLEGWEGLYIADWNSKVLTHPAEPVIGKVMREGDKLEELRNAMLSSDGVYNVGIISSPASGEIIMSMYAPVYDSDGTPLGYVGAGTFVNANAAIFADVSSLGLSSAYIYFVDSVGTMLYHPDESKIGNPVENAAVKGLVERIAKGESPEPECIQYEYKGASKYAAYYVGEDNAYIAVLTADHDDVMQNINKMTTVCIILCVFCILLFGGSAILVAKRVAKPLGDMADATVVLSTGDVTAECNSKSGIKEVQSVIQSFGILREALLSSMSNVKSSASSLNTAIISVDDKTAKNVESITQINEAINEVSDTSQVVAEHAQQMSDRAKELGSNIETLAGNVVTLYDSSQVIKNANAEATDCMKSVLEGANESVDAMKSITDKINETNDAIADISSAIQAIESIAAQTNLLSLNASIEAARAGEAGKGFAVVADEIRSLADSSANSAKDIKVIIENIIKLSEETVEISNRVSEVVSKEKTDIETTQGRFNVLSDSVESSISDIATIRKMTDRLDDIKAMILEATSELGAVSEQLGASAEEVAASCQIVTDACTDTQASTEEMRAVNEHMIEAVDFFKL